VHLAVDYIHPTPRDGRCRIRIYLPQDERDKPVWIEHYPKEATDGHSETFELVVFSSYEVKERAPCMGETRLTVGEPVWKALDRKSVEALVGQEV
jgi:hypothetical protein